MKRFLAVLLITCLCVSICGCGASSREKELQAQVDALESRLEQLEQALEQQSGEPAGAAVFEETDIRENPEDNPQAARLKAQISSVEEAAAWLDSRFPELWMSAHLNDGMSDDYWLDSGDNIVMRDPNMEVMGRSCVVNAVTYLLRDDMEIYSIIGFWHDETGGGPLKAINCIRTGDGYRFVDPVASMQGNEMSTYGQQLPQAQTASLEEYVQIVLAQPELAETLDSLYLFEQGQRIDFTQNDAGWVTLKTEPVQQLYLNSSRYQTDEEYHAMRLSHVIPENIHQYGLSAELGGITLTADEAYALVDEEPEVVKQKVKTAADVLMYMLAAQIGDNGGCYCDNWDGYTWHTNFTAYEVMERKLSNCGASANLANYLLEGDYEEIGFILHAYYPGNGGGHVYNYILDQGKYYIVDYSWYIFANYDPQSDFPVMRLNALEDFRNRVGELYGGVSLVISHKSSGRHLPNIFGEEFGDNHYYVPENAEYSVLFQAEDGYQIGEMPFDKRHYDWNRFR